MPSICGTRQRLQLSQAVLVALGRFAATRNVQDAVDAGDAADAILKQEEAARRVNASYAVEAGSDGLPLHIKDRVRAAGPSVRKDLGVNPDIQLEKA